jgi:hypothetical protein
MAEEIENTGDTGEELPTIDESFRALLGEANEAEKRMKQLALRAEQAGDVSAANVLREVAGTVLGLLKDLIGESGSAFEHIEGQIPDADDDSELTDEDAEELHGLLTANLRVCRELHEAAPLGSDARDSLQKLITLNEEKMAWVVEVSDFDPDDTDGSPSAPALTSGNA